MKILMGKAQIQAGMSVAASQPYTLTVLNENKAFQQFALFQTLPDLIVPSQDPLSLAWMLGAAAGGSSGNPSRSQFSWVIDYAASTGYIQQFSSNSPRQYSTSSSVSVGVSSDNKVIAQYVGQPFPKGAPAFGQPENGTSGLIQVQADDSIPTSVQQDSNKMFISVGIAMDGKPTVAVQLLPNLAYQFTPKPSYYIVSGSFIEGQVIDTAVISQAFKVEFDGVTDRTLVFTEKNQFRSA